MTVQPVQVSPQRIMSCVILLLVVFQLWYSSSDPRPVEDNRKKMKSSPDVPQPLLQPPAGSKGLRPPPFDPFVDLTFSAPTNERASETPAYSSFHCLGLGTRDINLQNDEAASQGPRPNYLSRSCSYRNLYYSHGDQTFHYFASPKESNFWSETLKMGNASLEGLGMSKMEVTLDSVTSGGILSSDKTKRLFQPWKPIIHESPPPLDSYAVVGPKEAVFLLYRPFHSMNIGHFIWDDLLALFSLLARFGIEQDDSIIAVPFFVELRTRMRKGKRKNYGGRDHLWRCNPTNVVKWAKCVKLFR